MVIRFKDKIDENKVFKCTCNTIFLSQDRDKRVECPLCSNLEHIVKKHKNISQDVEELNRLFNNLYDKIVKEVNE